MSITALSLAAYILLPAQTAVSLFWKTDVNMIKTGRKGIKALPPHGVAIVKILAK